MATPSASLCVCVYGARVITRHLDALEAQIPGVHASKDIEAIHQTRVASRRLRSALAIFMPCFRKGEYKKILKDVRAVTRALGEARDLDVQIEYLKSVADVYASPRFAPGIRRLKLRLTQKRQSLQTRISQAMEAFESDDVSGQIRRWASPLLVNGEQAARVPADLCQLAFQSVSARIADLQAHDQDVRDPSKVAELHAARISAKSLRYTLEAFEDLYGDPIKPFISEVKRIQELLGNLHDLDVWIALIPAFIAEERERIESYFGQSRPLRRLIPGLDAFRQDQINKRGALYQEFLSKWESLARNAVWTRLGEWITPRDESQHAKVACTPEESGEE